LLLLQHFTGTLDNWDPALTDALAGDRELILLDNAGVGRSSGAVPTTVAGMAQHVVTFLDGVGVNTCDVLGFSLGGMIAQQMVLDRPSIFRRVILVGTAPRGGEDIMHLEKPRLESFAELRTIQHPALVVNGVHDEMIPIANSYRLVENLPNAVLLTYPDAGHGSLFQYHESFARQAAAFLSSSSESAVY
jgi:pimeloyl-ACP methyl ester carboxylesterase